MNFGNLVIYVQTKLKSASTIVLTGKNVSIVECQSKSAEQALHNQPFAIGSTLFPLH